MDQSLEELRAQRELIRKHLEWIDRQLAAAETGKPNESTSGTDGSSKATKASPTKTTPLPEAADGTAPDESHTSVNDDPARLHAPAPVDLTRAKIGCLALFFLSSFLFLFLLFGLPYLMD